LEKKLLIPTIPALLEQQLPTFLGSLWFLNLIFKEMDTKMKCFFEASNKEYILSASDSEHSSPP
jgi:hypothetical protein